MKKIIEFLSKQKLFVNLLVFMSFVLGYNAITGMNREAFPQVNFDMVTIETLYIGASPDDIEQLVTIPIEKKLRGISGLDKVRSYNVENVSVIVVYLEMNNPERAQVVQDIKDAVETVDNLPDSAGEPLIEELKLDKTNVMNIAVFRKNDKVSYKDLRDTADRLEDYLYDIKGVAEVESYAFLDKEYLVEVDTQKLIRDRIGINYVMQAIQQRNIDLPGGELRIKDEEYLLKTKAQYRDAKDIANTVIWSNDLGYVTRVKDIAIGGKVKDTFEEAKKYERINKANAIVFTIKKKKTADEIVVADTIYKALPEFKCDKNIEIYSFKDTSVKTRDRIESVVFNAITGFVLLAAIIFLLMGPRMAAVIMIGFPISFMIGFFGMDIGGLTINVISLFGMIMVLGMIVDFGIVTTENTHRYLELGYDKLEAIKTGVSEVAVPLVVTFMCLVSVFMPLALLGGIVGKFVKAIPIVVMICLGASLLAALFIMPTHLNIIAREPKKKKSKQELKEIEEGYEKGFFGMVQHKYRSLLEASLKHRYITLVILVVLLFASFSLVAFGVIPFKFMPSGGSADICIKTYMPQGTNLQANLREIKKLENVIEKTIRKDEFDTIRVRVGSEDFGIIDPQPEDGTHKSTVLLRLTEEKDRKRIASEIVAELRKNIDAAQNIKDPQKAISKKMLLKVEVQEGGPPVGKPINVEIRGEDFAVMNKIADEYIEFLKTIDGVYDVKIDMEPGKLEYRYKIDEVMAARTGVSATDVAYALNAAYAGAVATNVHKNKEEIAVRVRFPEKARQRKGSLRDVMIMNQQGGLIPLRKVTSDVQEEYGTAFINRLNYKRLVQVQGEVDVRKITSRKVNTMLAKKFKDIENRYSDYSIAYGGEQEDSDESMGELGNLFLLALLVIYVILAVYFESLMLPLIVMIAIPFALVGVIFAVLVHGETMSFMSMMGLFALAGVIVSNTLVLVQFINNLREKGVPLKDALLEGGVIRLRPVLLTSGTTVLGLFPTIYGLGGKDYFVGPLALAFGYGLIFATFITLVLIPTFYYIAEDIKGNMGKLVHKIMGLFGFGEH